MHYAGGQNGLIVPQITGPLAASHDWVLALIGWVVWDSPMILWAKSRTRYHYLGIVGSMNNLWTWMMGLWRKGDCRPRDSFHWHTLHEKHICPKSDSDMSNKIYKRTNPPQHPTPHTVSSTVILTIRRRIGRRKYRSTIENIVVENSGWVLILTLKGTVFSKDREMPRDWLHLFISTNSRGETRTHHYQIIVTFFKSSFMSFQRTNTAASNLWVYSVTQDLSNSEGGNVHWLQGQIKMKYVGFKIK